MIKESFYYTAFEVFIEGLKNFVVSLFKVVATLFVDILLSLLFLLFAVSDSLGSLVSICKRYRVISTLIIIIIILASCLITSITTIWHLRARQSLISMQMEEVILQNDSLRHAEIKFTKNVLH